jgi:hypothetical protein
MSRVPFCFSSDPTILAADTYSWRCHPVVCLEHGDDDDDHGVSSFYHHDVDGVAARACVGSCLVGN